MCHRHIIFITKEILRTIVPLGGMHLKKRTTIKKIINKHYYISYIIFYIVDNIILIYFCDGN